MVTCYRVENVARILHHMTHVRVVAVSQTQSFGRSQSVRVNIGSYSTRKLDGESCYGDYHWYYSIHRLCIRIYLSRIEHKE
jgi:hypothetical protein